MTGGSVSRSVRFPSHFSRPLVGLAQGVALWIVHTWYVEPSTHGVTLRETALMLALLVPPLVLIGTDHLRRTTLLGWTAVAAALVTGIAIYGVWRRDDVAVGGGSDLAARIFYTAAMLYVVHHLLEPADEARRLRPPYAAYVDGSWRHGFQLALSALFIAVLAGILSLAALLFGAIGLHALPELLESARLRYPLLGLAFGIAMARTDVRPELIDGVRRVVLLLFAWLLPLLAALGTLFVVLLPFTGLAPLWATRNAAALLLFATALLVVLVNAAYQDGRDPASVSLLVRWSARVGGLLLPLFVALAGWALWQRVVQHGLSPERVAGLATCAFAAVYAVGYAMAALRRGPWMRTIEGVNVVAAICGVSLVLSLSSPIADPARLAAADQTRRLATGRTSPAGFDYTALRFDMARYGHEALAALARSANADVAARARLAQAAQRPGPSGKAHGEAFANARVLPDGATLPKGFREQSWSGADYAFGTTACLSSESPCDLYVLDLDRDGQEDVLVVSRANYGAPTLFERAADGSWYRAGTYVGRFTPSIAGSAVTALPPLPIDDLRVGEERLRFMPDKARKAPAAP